MHAAERVSAVGDSMQVHYWPCVRVRSARLQVHGMHRPSALLPTHAMPVRAPLVPLTRLPTARPAAAAATAAVAEPAAPFRCSVFATRLLVTSQASSTAVRAYIHSDEWRRAVVNRG